MRKAIIPIALATLLVAMLGPPAMADKPDTRAVMPLPPAMEAWNPCTETLTQVEVTGELHIHALPSIEAFFSGDDEHATLKWIGRFIGEDGYSMPRRHYGTLSINNGAEGDRSFAVTEVTNLMFTGIDGGKYRVSTRFHLTEVGGELKALVGFGDASCIRRPAG